MTPSAARLEVVAGRAIGMSILLDDELLIGRHADGAGRLADDEEISRSHARISLDRSGFCAIEDLGSTNGTFVNGLRIARPQTLSVGDTVEVGSTTLVVRELPIPASERSLKAVPPQPTLAPETEPGQGTGRGTGAPSNQETPATASQHAAKPAARAPEENTGEATAPVSLSLTLNVDFGAREATVALDEHCEPIRLVFDGEAWRPAPS
ncbi:MAG TPA: FHA domain-containing protein [Solirubrobacteraceae bacterium]|nr:FHA domain-containing protein [Solirubrobacteraceae bacterium]